MEEIKKCNNNPIIQREADKFIMVRELHEGDIFGEISLLTNFRRTASVVANKACIFQTLSKDIV